MTKQVRTTIYMPEELHERVKALASKKGQSLSKIVVEYLEWMTAKPVKQKTWQERLRAKAYKIDLTGIPKKDKEELKKALDDLHKRQEANGHAFELSEETEKMIEDSINGYYDE